MRVATATGTTAARSPAGWSRVNHSMKMAIPVFWTPVSTAMAMMSSLDLPTTLLTKQPKLKPNQGRKKPATVVRVGRGHLTIASQKAIKEDMLATNDFLLGVIASVKDAAGNLDRATRAPEAEEAVDDYRRTVLDMRDECQPSCYGC